MPRPSIGLFARGSHRLILSQPPRRFPRAPYSDAPRSPPERAAGPLPSRCHASPRSTPPLDWIGERPAPPFLGALSALAFGVVLFNASGIPVAQALDWETELMGHHVQVNIEKQSTFPCYADNECLRDALLNSRPLDEPRHVPTDRDKCSCQVRKDCLLPASAPRRALDIRVPARAPVWLGSDSTG